MVDLHRLTALVLNSDSENLDGVFLPFHSDIELMQFTGFVDRKGREIYEGDVIAIKNMGEYAVRRTIKWSDSESGFNLPGNIYSFGNPWEVIGNVYEDEFDEEVR